MNPNFNQNQSPKTPLLYVDDYVPQRSLNCH